MIYKLSICKTDSETLTYVSYYDQCTYEQLNNYASHYVKQLCAIDKIFNRPNTYTMSIDNIELTHDSHNKFAKLYKIHIVNNNTKNIIINYCRALHNLSLDTYQKIYPNCTISIKEITILNIVTFEQQIENIKDMSADINEVNKKIVQLHEHKKSLNSELLVSNSKFITDQFTIE
jgi:hypothetical protein